MVPKQTGFESALLTSHTFPHWHGGMAFQRHKFVNFVDRRSEESDGGMA